MISLAIAAGIRYALIEPPAIAHLCGAAEAPWWCAPRALAAFVLDAGALGFAALAAGLVATFLRTRGWALAAACLGAGGLVLYGVVTGAAGFLLGLLVLARKVGPRRCAPNARGEEEG